MTAPKEHMSMLDEQFVLLKKCEAILSKLEFDSLLSWLKLSVKAEGLEKVVAMQQEQLAQLKAKLATYETPKNQLKD